MWWRGLIEAYRDRLPVVAGPTVVLRVETPVAG